MALRKIYSFEPLPKGIVDNALLPGGLNRGNGLSYLNDPHFVRTPDDDSTNPLQIDAEGFSYCPQAPVIGSNAVRSIRILPTVFKAGWTKQFYGTRVKIHREASFSTAGSHSLIGLYNNDDNTIRLPVMTFNEMLAALGGYFKEGYLELEAYRSGATLFVDVYINDIFVKTATTTNTTLMNLFSAGSLAMGFIYRQSSTTPRSTSGMYKDIVVYDDVLDYPDSVVARLGPTRLKPIYFEEVAGEGWTSNGGTFEEVINSEITPGDGQTVYLRNDTAQTPLTMKLRTDIDANLPIYGVSFDVSLNTAETQVVNFNLSLDDNGTPRNMVSGTTSGSPIWGLTGETVDTDLAGEDWTANKLNGTVLTLSVGS